jgi:hypothetical protein
MEFKLKIPERDLPILLKILALNDIQKEVLLNKFKNLKTTTKSQKIEEIGSVEGFNDILIILEELITLFILYQSLLDDQIVKTIEDFVSLLLEPFKEDYKLKNQNLQEDFEIKIQSMNNFLKTILTSNNSLFLIEKSKRLLGERAKLIGNTRIITDIRPVFKEEKIDEPNNCLIIHNLRIEYTKDFRSQKRTYYALDHQDLIDLQTQIKRALEKEEEMKKICQKAGLTCLEV